MMSDSEKMPSEGPAFENEAALSATKKGPLSFFSGAMTSGVFAWLSLTISKQLVGYFALHSIEYKSPIAQSVASGFKTLIIGTSFLATFTFGFIAFGLSLVFIRSLFDVKEKDVD